jgi:amino acid transporter
MQGREVGLKRVLGFWELWSMMLGLIVCSTTLMVLGYGFGDLGAGFTWVQLIALCFATIMCVVYSELATMYPTAGGVVAYTRMAMGRAGSTLIGYWFGFKDMFGLAAESTLGGLIMEYVWPVLPWYIWAFIILTIFTITNLLGIDIAGKTQLAAVIFMVASYIGLGVVGFTIGHPNYEYLSETFVSPPSSTLYGTPGGIISVLALSLMGVWLFVGAEINLSLAEEVKNPQRTIPLAIISAFITIFAIQQFAGLAWAASVPKDTLLTGFPPPHIGAAEHLLGVTGVAWFAVISFIAVGTTLNAVIASISRMFYDMGREKELPKLFAWLHPRFRTPWGGILTLYALILIVIGSAAAYLGTDAPFFLALLTSFVFMITYIFFAVDLLLLRRKQPDITRPFYAGGPRKFPIITVIALIIAVVFLYFSTAPPFGDVRILETGAVYCAVGAVVGLLILKKLKGSTK